jgi:fucokinase
MIKSCLIITGIIPKEGGNLEEILLRIGSGFIIEYEVLDTPRGSGLGTASILCAAIIKAIFEFFGIEHNENDIVNKVLEVEQILGTGGGWQDTIGGLHSGLKLITTEKGIYQKLNIRNININKNTLEELEKRYLLINTGERRLSRTLLKVVVERYIGNIEENILALNESKNIADKMVNALEEGNIDMFANLLNEQWECSLKIIPETTTNLINGIFSYIEEFIEGKMICGPGGGGFLQVILKKGVSPEAVKQRIMEIFDYSDIKVWECSFEL